MKTTTILVIELPISEGRSVSSQLRSSGYNVLAARTTNEAYALLQGHPEIAFLLADLMAPGTFGAADLAKRVSAVHAGLQMLISTNLGRFALTNDDRSHGAQPLIEMLRIFLEDG